MIKVDEGKKIPDNQLGDARLVRLPVHLGAHTDTGSNHLQVLAALPFNKQTVNSSTGILKIDLQQSWAK